MRRHNYRLEFRMVTLRQEEAQRALEAQLLRLDRVLHELDALRQLQGARLEDVAA